MVSLARGCPILTRNSTVCYKTEDATTAFREDGIKLEHGNYFRGNETWSYLTDARNRGVLFARKFDSGVRESISLEDDIRVHLWETADKKPE